MSGPLRSGTTGAPLVGGPKYLSMLLAKPTDTLYMPGMRRPRPAKALLRAAFAAMFAFVSLAHGPVMTFAQAHGAVYHQHHQVAAAHGQGHHHHDVDVDAQSSPPASDAICFAVGCFASLASPAADNPDVIRTLAGKLSPPIVRALLPATMDPADPPPRLQV